MHGHPPYPNCEPPRVAEHNVSERQVKLMQIKSGTAAKRQAMHRHLLRVISASSDRHGRQSMSALVEKRHGVAPTTRMPVCPVSAATAPRTKPGSFAPGPGPY